MNMDQIGQFLPMLLIIVVFYFFVKMKKAKDHKKFVEELKKGQIFTPNNLVTKEQSIEQSLIIPDSCPHCKNPNTKKIRLCEWCGNQII
jgi:hypothetical protein